MELEIRVDSKGKIGIGSQIQRRSMTFKISSYLSLLLIEEKVMTCQVRLLSKSKEMKRLSHQEIL
jgi:hypothetical protein